MYRTARNTDMDRGLCEGCIHYSYHRIGQGLVRERCEVVARAFDEGGTGSRVIGECIHYDADEETEVP